MRDTVQRITFVSNKQSFLYPCLTAITNLSKLKGLISITTIKNFLRQLSPSTRMTECVCVTLLWAE